MPETAIKKHNKEQAKRKTAGGETRDKENDDDDDDDEQTNSNTPKTKKTGNVTRHPKKTKNGEQTKYKQKSYLRTRLIKEIPVIKQRAKKKKRRA